MEAAHCDKCGASLKKYWHKITPGLVHTLVKMYERVNAKGENSVHKSELTLTHGEYGNFQKLRFHALIAKYTRHGVWKRGHWLITRRGADFLGGSEIPESVQTFRNKVVAHSSDMITVAKVIGQKDAEYFQTDFAFNLATEEDLVEVPVVKRMNKKKRSKPGCPNCGTALLVRIITEPGETAGSLKAERWLMCPTLNCGYKEHKEL